MKCKTCGAEFELGPGENARKYCSVKCRRKMERILYKQRNGVPVSERACIFCGKIFHPRRTIDVCCSTECRKGHQKFLKKQRRDENKMQPRKCDFCGKEYVPYHRNQRFCTCVCGKKARYFENAEEVKRRVTIRRKERRDRSLCSESGLTFGQMREINRLQDGGDRMALFEASKKWTPAQRKYAKKRYEKTFGYKSYKFE